MINVKDMSDNELAVIVKTMAITGLAPTRFEKECLKETSERLKGDSDVKLYKIKRKERASRDVIT